MKARKVKTLKKQSNLSRLLEYAGTYRILTCLSWALSAAGALLALVPFWYIWRILSEVIEVAPHHLRDGRRDRNLSRPPAARQGRGFSFPLSRIGHANYLCEIRDFNK